MTYANMTNEEILSEKLDIAYSKINQLERERDEARREVERAEAKTAAEYEAHKMTKCERDELRAEIERLKSQSNEQNRCFNKLRELWKHLPNIENKYDERLACHLGELIERLKADKARLDWRINHCAGNVGDLVAIRFATSASDSEIESAMKGAE